jgi:hypothetical protein
LETIAVEDIARAPPTANEIKAYSNGAQRRYRDLHNADAEDDIAHRDQSRY